MVLQERALDGEGALTKLIDGALLRFERIHPNVVERRYFNSRTLIIGALMVIMFNFKFR